jgi:RimJ/RimL family protein N-acetyltransferase
MQNPEALKERLKFYISCYEKNIGMQAIIWKETNEMVGWSGLQPLENTEEIEVGYGMIKEFWGKGIGFETALFWLKYGFEKLGLDRIVAVADKENVGSWKIMEKLGMKYEKTEEHYGMDCVFYAISKNDFGRETVKNIVKEIK